MAKIREELEIVSSDDLNSLLNRLNKLKDEIKDTNNTTVKPKTDSSEIDKANIKLDNLRKNAQSGIDAKVNVQLDASDLKKLNNLPTAKALSAKALVKIYRPLLGKLIQMSVENSKIFQG